MGSIQNDCNEEVQLPTTSKHLVNHHIDTRRWDEIKIRDGDVFIGTYPKSGTTWMQQIVRSLLGLSSDIRIDQLAPWVDMRVSPLELVAARLEAQQHRRFMKHHSALPYIPVDAHTKGSHIYVARDGRDVVMSLHAFHRQFTPEYIVDLNAGKFDGPRITSAPEDVVSYFETWLRNDGAPFWPYWEHIRTWWCVRNHPRVLLTHYGALEQDPNAEIRRVYDFLKRYGDVSGGSADDVVAGAVANSTFSAMKKRAAVSAPRGGEFLANGGSSFFRQGKSQRWRGVLPDDLVAEYEEMAVRELGAECARWLATGCR